MYTPSSEFAQLLSQQDNRVVEEPAAAKLTKGKKSCAKHQCQI